MQTVLTLFGLAALLVWGVRRLGVTVDVVRTVDHVIPPGVQPDMREHGLQLVLGRTPGSALPWLPICVARFFSFANCRTMRASSTVWTNGFWQKQCLPIFMARMAATPWV